MLYSSDSVSLSPLRLVASRKGQRAEGPLKLLPPFKKVAKCGTNFPRGGRNKSRVALICHFLASNATRWHAKLPSWQINLNGGNFVARKWKRFANRWQKLM